MTTPVARLRRFAKCWDVMETDGTKVKPAPSAMPTPFNKTLAKGPSSTMILSEEYLVEKLNTSVRGSISLTALRPGETPSSNDQESTSLSGLSLGSRRSAANLLKNKRQELRVQHAI
jgi:hypothetical protein